MVKHFLLLTGTTALLVAVMFYPYLPGQHDILASELSGIVQLLGAVGLLLVPLGVAWLVYELKKRVQREADSIGPGKAFYFAIVAMCLATFLAAAVSLLVFLAISKSLGVLTFALCACVVARLWPSVKSLKAGEPARVNPAPFYVIVIPLALLFFQMAFAASVTESSRNHAIQSCATLIEEIERHHAEHGGYPASMLAVWKDYDPDVVGVEKFHYAPSGEAYNLVFEQPRLLFHDFGTREFVMYNKRDEHVMPSHASWILVWSPEMLRQNQGWYTVQDASSAHWKRFLFD